MHRSLVILFIVLFSAGLKAQDTTLLSNVWNFLNGIQIDSIGIKEITFYNDDSLRIISGDGDTIMVGGTSSGGNQDLSGYQQDTDTTTFDGTKHDIDTSLTNAKNYTDTEISNLNFIAPGDTAPMLAPYAKQQALEDSIAALNATIASIQAVNNSIRDSIQAFNADSGEVAIRVYAGDTSNYPVPDFAGQLFLDTATPNKYISIGSSRGDWKDETDMVIWLACLFRIRRKNKKHISGDSDINNHNKSSA